MGASASSTLKQCMSDMFAGNQVAVDMAMSALTDVQSRRTQHIQHLIQLLPSFDSSSAAWPPNPGSTVSTDRGEKTYTLVKRLGTGTYGVVYLLDDGSVMKVAIAAQNPGGGGDDNAAVEMVLEAVVHSFMQCLKSRYTCTLPFPIPKIHALGWMSNNDAPAIVMEAMGRSVGDEVANLSELQLVHIIMQVCYHLRCLQQAFGFAHKDLNSGNVMIRRRAAPLDVTLDLGDGGVRMQLEHDVFFIDFGTTCLDTRSCATCSDEADVFRTLNPILSALEFPKMSRADACQNTSFDLRVFLGAILYQLSPARHPNVCRWLQTKIDEHSFPLFYAKVGDARFHSLYENTSVLHPNLMPQSVFQSLVVVKRNLETPPTDGGKRKRALSPASSSRGLSASSSGSSADAHAAALKAAMAALAEREQQHRQQRRKRAPSPRNRGAKPALDGAFFGIA